MNTEPECKTCGLAMNLIENKTLWHCPMGCGSHRAVIPKGVEITHKKITLSLFLSYFFHEEEPFWIFGFSPKDVPEELKSYPTKIETTIKQLVSDKGLQQRLKKVNEEQGLYFVVNAGGTTKEEIHRINALFCEDDDATLTDQHDALDNAPYPPSIRIETKRSVHAYWLLGEKVGVEKFEEMQSGLIRYFGSDRSIQNVNRLMRLPFFNHISFDQGEYISAPVKLHTFTNTAFSEKELRESFPPSEDEEIVEPTVWAKEYDRDGDVWEKVFGEMAQKFRDVPGYHVERGGRLASARGICHHGDTNRTLVLNLQTNKIFCRAGCRWDEIRQALGVELPKAERKRHHIPRVEAPKNTSALYEYLVNAGAL